MDDDDGGEDDERDSPLRLFVEKKGGVDQSSINLQKSPINLVLSLRLPEVANINKVRYCCTIITVGTVGTAVL
jgi:hypothetical protein